MTEAEKRIADDTHVFDEFLHVTNESAFAAMKTAEDEINRHIEKVNQIKSINAQICEVRSDICRLEDVFALKDEIKQFIFLVEKNESNSENKPLIITSPEWKNIWKKMVRT